MIVEYILIYLLIGICAGTLSGLLGIGSGVFVVPALAYVFSQQNFPPDLVMHVAAGTCLANMVFTTLRSLLVHLKRQVRFWHIYRKMGWGVIVGTLLGALFANQLHTQTLRILFSVVLFFSAINMFLPFSSNQQRHLPGSIGCSLAGLLIGGKSGLLGIGGGSVSVPFLRYFGVSIREAIVVSSAIGVTVSIIGSVSFAFIGFGNPELPAWTTGYIYWPAWLGIFLGSLFFVSLGAKLSHLLPAHALHYLFAVFLLIVGVHMLYAAFS